MSFRREYERWMWGDLIGRVVVGVLALALIAVALWEWVGVAVVVAVAAVVYGVLRHLERPRAPRPEGRPVTVGGVALGQLAAGVRPHRAKECAGRAACPEHRPTQHRMLGWLVSHGSATDLTVRCCQHGLHHPDPDDTRWPAAAVSAHRAECDGCCPAP